MGFRHHFAEQQFTAPNCRYGSKGDETVGDHSYVIALSRSGDDQFLGTAPLSTSR
jgi:hypothetical protein